MLSFEHFISRIDRRAAEIYTRQRGTEKARKARRRDDIQIIIVEESEELWKKKPKLRENTLNTAREIHEKVINKVSKLETPQPSLKQSDDTKLQRKQIELIRKRLERAKRNRGLRLPSKIRVRVL